METVFSDDLQGRLYDFGAPIYILHGSTPKNE
jgi:hypothetical protein